MPSTPPSPSGITMEKAKELFADWRANRTVRSKIPAHLWEVVLHLIKVQGHSFTQVGTTLGINYQQLKRNIGPQIPRDKTLPAASHFIKIDLPLSQPIAQHLSQTAEHPMASPPAATLELRRSDGTLLKASGIPSQDVLLFAERFIA